MNLFYALPVILMQPAQQGDQAQKGGPFGILVTFLPFLLIIGVLYFFSIRPQKKREKEMREKLSLIRPGDEVMTIGGIIGRVANVNDDEVTIYTSVSNTMLTFKKQAISNVIKPDAELETKDNAKTKSDDKPEKKSRKNKDKEIE